MALTPAQLTTLKAAILADPTLSAQPLTSGGAQVIADAMNAAAVPAFTVWKSNVSIAATGQAFNGTPLPLLGGVMVFSSLALVLITRVRKKPH